MVQEGRGDDGVGGPVQVVMVTHTAAWGAVSDSLAELAKSDFSSGTPRVIRIEDP
jgi:hypothetical protein